jgi:hypothetical protein
VRAKAIAAIAAATAIAALLAPGAAAAAGPVAKGREHNPTLVSSLVLRGSHGYLVGVTLINRRKLEVTATPEGSNGPGGLFNVVTDAYSLHAPQPRGLNGIKASLGKFGRIDLRFVPDSESEVKALLSACKGEKYKVQIGTFVGRIAFRGARGYTRARATHVFGTVLTAPAPSCHNSSGHRPHERSPHQRARSMMIAMARRATKPSAHLLALGAATVAHGRKVGFGALRLSASKKGKEVAFDTFVATASRDLGRIHEEASATQLLLRGPYFKVPDLTRMTSEAMIQPPLPFLGSGTFRRESADKVSWVGDLRVTLPGFGSVPLAGPAFKTAMCLDSGCPTEE